MEKTMKIQKLLPIQDRQYNDQQGQPRVFTSMGSDRRLRPLACGTSTGRRLCARSTLDECS